MELHGSEILRNRGELLDAETDFWQRSLLIQVAGRKMWVVAAGHGHEEATRKVYEQAEALKDRLLAEAAARELPI